MIRSTIRSMFALACLLAAACGPSSTPAPAAPEPAPEPAPAPPVAAASPTPSGGNVYPPEMEEAFLTACTDSGGPLPICECTLAGLKRRYTADQMAGEEIPAEAVEEIVLRCINGE